MSSLWALSAVFAPSGQGGGLGATLFILIGWGAIFYFILIRPQRQEQKRHRARLETLKRGDEVVTAGGIIGAVVHLKDDRITIKSGESRFIVERQRIARVIEPGAKQTGKS